mgnify:CR=1 FL=1
MSEMTHVQTNTPVAEGANGRRPRESSSWFEKMAHAWGEALDRQADRIVDASELVVDGQDTPSQITAVTAESLRFGFLANSSHTSLTSVGSALETVARKQ